MDKWKTWGINRVLGLVKGVSSEEVKPPSKYICGKCNSPNNFYGQPFRNINELWTHYESCNPSNIELKPYGYSVEWSPKYTIEWTSKDIDELLLPLERARDALKGVIPFPLEGDMRVLEEDSSGNITRAEIYTQGRWCEFRNLVLPKLRINNGNCPCTFCISARRGKW